MKPKTSSHRKPTDATAPVTIREMELEDLPTIYALGEKLFTSELWPNLYRTWDVYELVDMFSSDSETCFVAEADDEILGFVLGTVIEKRRSAWNYGYVVWIGVDARSTRRGIGRRLMDRVTASFIKQGVRILLLDTDANNYRALAFFEQLGFGNKTHHVYLTKNLTHDAAYQQHKAPARSKPARKPKTKTRAKVRKTAEAGKVKSRRKRPLNRASLLGSAQEIQTAKKDRKTKDRKGDSKVEGPKKKDRRNKDRKGDSKVEGPKDRKKKDRKKKDRKKKDRKKDA